MQYFLSHAPNKDASIWHQSLIGAVENISPNETLIFIVKQLLPKNTLPLGNAMMKKIEIYAGLKIYEKA